MKRFEAELRQANQTLSSIIAASPQAIIANDRERNVRLWNPAATRIFGWSSEEVVGGRVPFIGEDQRDECDRFAESALRGESFMNYETRRTRRDGTKVGVLISSAPTYGVDGNIDGFVTVCTDITEYKALERQLLRSQRLESLGTLVSGIAHDMNNVLAPIAMALQLFRIKFTDAATQRTLNTLDTCVGRGSDLIRQILTFARGVQCERVPVRAGRLLHDTESVISQTLPKSITTCSEVADDLWPVVADATQLHQVMMNLCVNARDAMPEGGRLNIAARNVVLDETYVRMSAGLQAGPYVLVEIKDTGCGIPLDIRDRIFEPFFTTKTMGEGTGLGLSTVAAIVRNHGGHINVYSEVGRGTSFKIYLPALQEQKTQPECKNSSAFPEGGGELILIVDDETAVRDIAKFTLETHGYRVLEARDGAEAVAVYSRHYHEIQVVLSDMDMPVMNGDAMIRALERINPNVRVISASGLVTYRNTPPSGAVGGLRELLPKPYTAAELLRTVKSAITVA